MPLTSAQRARLPRSAFVYSRGPRSSWRYPVPTRAQAQRAGISEAQRKRTHAAAKSYAARRSTSGTPAKVKRVVKRRSTGANAYGGRAPRPRASTRTVTPKRTTAKRRRK